MVTLRASLWKTARCAALDLLSRHHAQATFFVNGWVAERRPELVREVVRQGHEIASAGLSQKSFRQWTEA